AASKLAAGVRSGVTDRESLLDELRPASFAIAYRMLGSVSEAEDVVQEALLRVHQAIEHGEQITSPRAYVATVTTRLAINELRSARARREQYVGEWLATASTILPSTPRWPTRCRWRCWCCSRACLRSSEPRCSCTTCSITAIRRSQRSSARARTTCANSRAGPGVTSRSAGAGGSASRPRASSARSSRRGFSAPPSRGI